jgi:hypothetical protein
MSTAKTIAFTVRLPEDLHTRAKLKVTREHTSLQKVVEEAVRNYVGGASDADFQRQLGIARRGMQKYRNTLAELAK